MAERNTPNQQDTAGIAALLRSRGVYPTAQRLGIASVLLSQHQHLTADGLHEKLLMSGLRMSKATVYNTLRLFVEKDLLREIVVDSGRTFYDSNNSHHSHYYNVDTAELIDAPAPVEPQIDDLSTPDGTFVESIDVMIRVRNKR